MESKTVLTGVYRASLHSVGGMPGCAVAALVQTIYSFVAECMSITS